MRKSKFVCILFCFVFFLFVLDLLGGGGVLFLLAINYK